MSIWKDFGWFDAKVDYPEQWQGVVVRIARDDGSTFELTFYRYEEGQHIWGDLGSDERITHWTLAPFPLSQQSFDSGFFE